ncbi:hypothetical protein HaLaN_02104 [Haematococcus lacustris]|uniref:Uncharacterized protein n=1 Tax=Haematococcus lacustris TaxID=44745 RepID=A0A699YMM1_HAELA|nr:hypothetical protein HaLaN_02104 [Haematococcus lacustris]
MGWTHPYELTGVVGDGAAEDSQNQCNTHTRQCALLREQEQQELRCTGESSWWTLQGHGKAVISIVNIDCRLDVFNCLSGP